MALFNKLFGQPEEAKTGDLEPEAALTTEEELEEGELAIDMYQDKDNLVLKSTIAGVLPEDLDITIANDMVTVKGERKRAEATSRDNYYYQECYYGSFSRSIMLPVEVDVDKAKADLKDGILTLILPKASRARTKKVRVKGSEE